MAGNSGEGEVWASLLSVDGWMGGNTNYLQGNSYYLPTGQWTSASASPPVPVGIGNGGGFGTFPVVFGLNGSGSNPRCVWVSLTSYTVKNIRYTVTKRERLCSFAINLRGLAKYFHSLANLLRGLTNNSHMSPLGLCSYKLLNTKPKKIEMCVDFKAFKKINMLNEGGIKMKRKDALS